MRTNAFWLSAVGLNIQLLDERRERGSPEQGRIAALKFAKQPNYEPLPDQSYRDLPHTSHRCRYRLSSSPGAHRYTP